MLEGFVQKSGKLDLPTLIQRLTEAPAKVLGLSKLGIGSISIGSNADLVLIDPESEWLVNASDFESKGKNTPLIGDVLKGRVKLTIANGNIVFDSEKRLQFDRNSFA